MNKFGRSIFLGLLLLAAANLSQAQLQPIPLDRAAQSQEVRVNPLANVRITERQAVALARERFAGNILRISLVGEGANRRYQIRMENEGKVFTVFVHATTGEVTGGS